MLLDLSKLVYILLLPLYCNINCMNLDILVNFEKCQYSCGDHWSKWPPVWRPRGLVMLFQRWEPRRKQPSPSSGSFQGSPINMIPAGLTSHACDPSTATGKSLRKVGTLDAVTSFRRHLGKPDTFCSFSPPTAVVQLTSGEVSHTNPLHLADLFTALLFLFGSFL